MEEDYESQHECWKWDVKGVCVECHQKTLDWADVEASDTYYGGDEQAD